MLSFVSNSFALGGIATQVSRVCGHVVVISPPKGYWIYVLGSGMSCPIWHKAKAVVNPCLAGLGLAGCGSTFSWMFQEPLGEQALCCGRGNRNGENVQ